jgi:lysophospholipase L1-like esterase
MGKKLLIVSLIGNIISIILFTVFIIKKGGVPYVEEKLLPATYVGDGNLKLKYINISEGDIQRQTLFDLLPIYKDDIIFIGNSITNGCEWAELFNNKKIKDRSIPGDNSSGILNRIDKIAKFTPQKIFLMIGINDLSWGIKIDSVIHNYVNIIKRIKFLSPETKIYIQSILPVNDDFENASNKDVIELNSKIKDVVGEYDLTYIDIYSYLLDSSGKLSKEYSNDGLHLLGAGYLKWKNIVEPYVN